MSAARAAGAILAGVDEAGLGPLLGSLAIGYSAFLVPAPDSDPWKLLRGTVARTPRKGARLVVADSKLVFQRNARGEKRLETTALAFLALRDGRIGRVGAELLGGALAPEEREKSVPWWAHLPALPWAAEPEGLELTASLLARASARAGLTLLDAGVRVVPAAELNASYAETENKATTVWARVQEVLARLWALRARAPLFVTVDMLGGRRHYGSLLARAFPEAEVRLVSETPLCSSYALAARDGNGAMALSFRVRGERHSFAVALASCLAKYARELEMRAFNAYFAALAPELRPTAGYRGDGSRWLEDAAAALEKCGLARDVLVRQR